MKEEWRAVVEYEGLYEVSDQGRVRSLVKRNRRWKPGILKPGDNGHGYLVVNLYKDGICKRMGVHRLVAETFIPNPLDLPQVNHKDENKHNNVASNLEWCTASYNCNYGTHNQQIAKALSKPVQQLDKQGKPIATFPSTIEAERQIGISQSSISKCCRGLSKSAGGFVWRYA